jgi:hypothetical protein
MRYEFVTNWEKQNQKKDEFGESVFRGRFLEFSTFSVPVPPQPSRESFGLPKTKTVSFG